MFEYMNKYINSVTKMEIKYCWTYGVKLNQLTNINLIHVDIMMIIKLMIIILFKSEIINQVS